MNKKIISPKNIYGVAKILTVEQLKGVYHITYDLEHNGVSTTLFKGEVITIVDNVANYKYFFTNKIDTIYTDGSIKVDNNTLVVTYTENSENPNSSCIKISFNLDTDTIIYINN